MAMIMWSALAIVVVAVAGGLYPLYLGPILRHLGHGRVIEPTDNARCFAVQQLQACESECRLQCVHLC